MFVITGNFIWRYCLSIAKNIMFECKWRNILSYSLWKEICAKPRICSTKGNGTKDQIEDIQSFFVWKTI